ncbi:MAG: hypothetical protein HYU77_04675 [Betaproteobacteria bacterium]|nr:hypothetical protein [Betaproteobacteria bacterium]
MTVARLLAVLLVLLPGAAQAQGLGRLFFSPDQRVVLENLKGRPSVPLAQLSETITINGLVQRSDGKSIVWINGVPQVAGQQASGAGLAGKPASAASVPVIVPGSGKTLSLKVGQSVDVSTSAVREGQPPPKSAGPIEQDALSASGGAKDQQTRP